MGTKLITADGGDGWSGRNEKAGLILRDLIRVFLFGLFPQIQSGLKLDFLLSPVMTYSNISTFLIVVTTHFTSLDDHIDNSSLPVTLHHKTLHFSHRMCLSMRCSLHPRIFHSINYWLAVWLLEPAYLGWNSVPAL